MWSALRLAPNSGLAWWSTRLSNITAIRQRSELDAGHYRLRRIGASTNAWPVPYPCRSKNQCSECFGKSARLARTAAVRTIIAAAIVLGALNSKELREPDSSWLCHFALQPANRLLQFVKM